MNAHLIIFHIRYVLLGGGGGGGCIYLFKCGNMYMYTVTIIEYGNRDLIGRICISFCETDFCRQTHAVFATKSETLRLCVCVWKCKTSDNSLTFICEYISVSIPSTTTGLLANGNA